MRRLALLSLPLVVLSGLATAAVADEAPDPSRREALPSTASRMPAASVDDATLQDLSARVDGLLGGAPARPVRARAVTTTPTITTPADAATVSGEAPVSATSTADQVRFSGLGRTWFVDVVDGVASSSWQTWGARGSQQLAAVDCDVDGCGSGADTVSASISNQPVEITQPVKDQVVGSSVAVSVTAPGGSLRVAVDGAPVADLPSAPYTGTVDTSGLSEGEHTLTVTSCDTAYVSCDGRSDSVTIDVQHSLSPKVVDLTPRVFSPNGDGRKDTASVEYRLDTPQQVTWSVEDNHGDVVRGPVSLGKQGAGTHDLTLNGKDRDGDPLTGGGYSFVLETSKSLGGETIHGDAERGFSIDVRAPGLDRPKASPDPLFPVKDGYRDSTALRTFLGEDATLVALVRSSSGRVVRRLDLGSVRDGRRTVRWNGRTASGSVVDAGRYEVSFQAQDAAGNRRTSASTALAVSGKKLVRHGGSQTVVPKTNAIGTIIGGCSGVFYPARPSWKGSLSHLSNYDLCWDPSDEQLLAFTRHQISVPKAVSYGTFKVSTYGGRTVSGYPDKGMVFYEKPNGDISSWGGMLAASTGWHASDKIDGDKLVTRKEKFRWWGGTANWWFYDIKSYRVTYSWFTLE